MATIRNATSDIDSASFELDLIVYCFICYRPLSRPSNVSGPGMPFWLTSCGHVTCADHMFPGGAPADARETSHACPVCKSEPISVAGLAANEIPDVLRDYFRPTTELLSDFTGALKFQYENVMKLARHYKVRSEELAKQLEQKRVVLSKVKETLSQAKVWKKENEDLKEETCRLRARLKEIEDRAKAHDTATPAQHPTDLPPGPPASKKRRISQNKDSLTGFKAELNARAAPASSQQSKRPPKQPTPPPPNPHPPRYYYPEPYDHQPEPQPTVLSPKARMGYPISCQASNNASYYTDSIPLDYRQPYPNEGTEYYPRHHSISRTGVHAPEPPAFSSLNRLSLRPPGQNVTRQQPPPSSRSLHPYENYPGPQPTYGPPTAYQKPPAIQNRVQYSAEPFNPVASPFFASTVDARNAIGGSRPSGRLPETLMREESARDGFGEGFSRLVSRPVSAAVPLGQNYGSHGRAGKGWRTSGR